MKTIEASKHRTDWRAEREGIDLAAVATGLLGPATGRIGERGRRLWWRCPFHEDRNPSLMIDPGRPWWKCWGCGERGDVATLVMKLEGVSFPEARSRLSRRSAASGTTRPRTSPNPKPPEVPEGPKGLPLGDAAALVVESEARIWTPEGMGALAYLTGPRGLSLGTIKAARLGWTPGVRLATKEGRSYTARGVVLPWFDGDRLVLVKIRQPEGDRPKYAEVFRDRPCFYPDRRVIRPGFPLIVPEGEFDALLLGQELDGLAAVVTLGGTGSTKPEPRFLKAMLPAPLWFIATDGDEAGDKAAARWEGTRAQRVRPPEPYKDWTEARQGGINLRRWWADFLGVPFPPYSWEALAGWRWGQAAELDPGIVLDRPEPSRPMDS